MDAASKNIWLKKTAAALVLPFAALSFVGCSTSGPEEGTTAEEVAEGGDEAAVDEGTGALAYDGVYDSAFYEDYDSLVGEEVTVSAQVNTIISPNSLTIAGTDDTTVEPLLVMHDQGDLPDVEEGLTIGVTGTVKEAFDVVTVEEDLGIDLDDDLYADWEGERYIEANSIDASVDADAG